MEAQKPCILAIESSCDDTAAAVIRDGAILSNVIASQAIHAKYGGIVPEVASRLHQENITLVVDEALQRANTSLKEFDAFAHCRIKFRQRNGIESSCSLHCHQSHESSCTFPFY